METRGIANPYVFFPGLVTSYPAFTQNQLGPMRSKESIQHELKEMWYAEQSISTPQKYRRDYFISPQMSTSILGIDPTTNQNAYNAMYYAPYAIKGAKNFDNQTPSYSPKDFVSLEVFARSKATEYTDFTIPGEKLMMGCKEIYVPLNNHEVRKSRSCIDPASCRKCPELINEANYEVNDVRSCKRTIATEETYFTVPCKNSITGCKEIYVPLNNHEVRKSRSCTDPASCRKCPEMINEANYEVNDVRSCKRTIDQVTREESSQDLMENPRIKRSCTVEFLEDVNDCPIKNDDDNIDVETVEDPGNVKKYETIGDLDETDYIDVVGLSDDENEKLLENVG